MAEHAVKLLQNARIETQSQLVLDQINKLEQTSSSRESFIDQTLVLIKDLLAESSQDLDAKEKLVQQLEQLRQEYLADKSPVNLRFRKFLASEKGQSEIRVESRQDHSLSRRSLARTPQIN